MNVQYCMHSFFNHVAAELFKARSEVNFLILLSSALKSNYRPSSYFPGLVCANVGRIGMLGHLSAR
jgi:hypothetical protein